MDSYLDADLRRARRAVTEAERRRDDQMKAVASLAGDPSALAFASRVLMEREHTLYLARLGLTVIEHLDDDKADEPSCSIASTTGSWMTSTTAL